MSDLGPLARRYGFDALIVLAAVESALEVALRHDARGRADARRGGSPCRRSRSIVLPLLARRRFPFAAPAASGSLAAAVSFVDGRLVVFTESSSVAGMAAAFLLGNLRDDVQARLGLADRRSAARRSSSTTTPTTPPASSSSSRCCSRSAGSPASRSASAPLRPRQAEERALEAERERESAARIAVAEERARIARELHDVVAHAVSVMVLQVGAVRHNLPEKLAADSDALKDVEQAGRSALAEMRRLLGAMRTTARTSIWRPSPGSTASTRSWSESAAPGFRCGSRSRATPSNSRARSTSPPTGSSRRA